MTFASTPDDTRLRRHNADGGNPKADLDGDLQPVKSFPEDQQAIRNSTPGKRARTPAWSRRASIQVGISADVSSDLLDRFRRHRSSVNTRRSDSARSLECSRSRAGRPAHIQDSPTSADWRGSGRGVPDDNDDVNELDGNPPPGMPPDSVIVCRPVSEIRGRLRVAELADDGAETPGGNTCEFKPPEGRTVSSDPIVSWLARDGYML